MTALENYDRNDFEIVGTTLVKYKGAGGDVVILEGVTAIGENAFNDCESLTSVKIPNSVTLIEDSAFEFCDALTDITIPSSVAYVGGWAFSYSGLNTVYIFDGLIDIDETTFLGCEKLEKIAVNRSNPKYKSRGNCIIERGTDKLILGCKTSVIPSYVTSIGNWAFFGCSGSTEVIIPSGVTSIGDFAFGECTGLTSVTIPNSVISIGDCAFCGCIGLTSVTIPNSVTSIGSAAFRGCAGLTSVTIPDSVTKLKNGAFLNCSKLTSVTIPSKIKSIHNTAFSNAPISWKDDSRPDIGTYAFGDCTSLKTIALPERFRGQKELYIPSSVQVIYY